MPRREKMKKMFRLRHTAHLNISPFSSTTTHASTRDRAPALYINEIGYKTVGVGAKACTAPCWQADCSVSAMCGRLRYVPQPSLRFRQRHRRGTCQSLLCYAPRLPPHRQTLRNTAMPTLRTARAFCAYS